jgi:DNA-binding MarR family transcriptional regulator
MFIVSLHSEGHPHTTEIFITTMIIITINIITGMNWVVGTMNQGESHWKLFATISGIYIKSRRIAEAYLKPYDVTWPQFGALFQLNQEDDITQTELATRLEGDTTTTMVLCNSLEKKGWITREKDPSDKRVNRLLLTDEGRAVFQKALPVMQKGYTTFAEAIPETRLSVVLPILEELYANVNQQYGEVLGK